MNFARSLLIATLALLTFLGGCASQPEVVQVAPAIPRVPQPPKEVMENDIPDYEAWMQKIFSSMKPASSNSPASQSAPKTPAKP